MTPLEQRFWSYVDRAGDCWNWTGALCDGYGVIGRGRRVEGLVRAHRLAWELANGPVPAGLFVCHACDNRRCCNPAHLFIGTNLDNVRDMRAKGRGSDPPKLFGDRNPRRINPPRGEANPGAKLTREKVADIRAQHRAGASVRDLAERYGVVANTIRAIATGQAW